MMGTDAYNTGRQVADLESKYAHTIAMEQRRQAGQDEAVAAAEQEADDWARAALPKIRLPKTGGRVVHVNPLPADIFDMDGDDDGNLDAIPRTIYAPYTDAATTSRQQGVAAVHQDGTAYHVVSTAAGEELLELLAGGLEAVAERATIDGEDVWRAVFPGATGVPLIRTEAAARAGEALARRNDQEVRCRRAAGVEHRTAPLPRQVHPWEVT